MPGARTKKSENTPAQENDGLERTEATEKAPTKRTRSNTKSSEAVSEPKAKKSRNPVTAKTSNESDLAVSKPARDEAPKVKKGVEPRDPLPIREKRVQNPGLVDQKTGRRVSAQVLKEERKRDALEQQIEKLMAEKMALLAHMEVKQAQEEADEQRTMIKHFSDTRIQVAGEEMDSEYAVAPVDIAAETEEGVDGHAKKGKPRKKKPERGQTRSAVEALKTMINNEKTMEASENKPGTEAPQPRPKHLTGLVTGWTSIPRSQVLSATAISTPNGASLGGLTDEDIAGRCPSPEPSVGCEQRTNNLVLVVSDESDYEPHTNGSETPAFAKQLVPRASSKKKQASSGQATLLCSTPTPVKCEESSSSAASFVLSTPTSDSDRTSLPHFARAEWVPRFLPTLYHCILSNNDPFESFLGGKALETIQLVVDTVFPSSGYRVPFRSRLYDMAYERGTELRSKFGSQAIKIVTRFFEQPDYQHNSEAISRYVQWAVRADGPMLFRVPSPEHPAIGDAKAVDPFQSRFIVELVTPTLRWMRGSVGHEIFGEPKAAFALAAAGLERAFLAFESGRFVKPTQIFGTDTAGDTVKEYMESCDRFTECRWTQLKAACGVEAEKKRNAAPSSSSLNGKRCRIYVASSPPPEAGDSNELY